MCGHYHGTTKGSFLSTIVKFVMKLYREAQILNTLTTSLKQRRKKRCFTI
ncbi:hypothetical protein SAMN04488502_11012 [Dendrosporobacter quercicolus]|uniref:Uncharacterized protein n=1 Tax=Dendrosporobacter quercicolus TaxID=146817 RepID=A0A1G9XQ34_9FIRM|nr:hypothetical protein SAMN04488502_11012 [Dendrosporobacter quercicolus]